MIIEKYSSVGCCTIEYASHCYPDPEVLIPQRVIFGRAPMRSGVGEQEDRNVPGYHAMKQVNDKGHTYWHFWIPDSDNPGDTIYQGWEHDAVNPPPHSEGFAGRIMEFRVIQEYIYGKPLVHEPFRVKIQGPWHSNSGSLYRDTGIDLRFKNRTFVACGLSAVPNPRSYFYTYDDLVYCDPPEGMLGHYYRGEAIALRLAKTLGKTVYRCILSDGGGSYGSIPPERISTYDIPLKEEKHEEPMDGGPAAERGGKGKSKGRE